jgi:hypothetical protein
LFYFVFCSVILSLITFVILLATGLHIAYGHRHDFKFNGETNPTGYESISTRTTEATATTETVTTTTVNTSLPEEDENAPLIARTQPPVDSGKIFSLKNIFLLFEFLIVAQKLISCCSLINNYHLLKHDYEAKTLSFLNGIRVLSLCWVILGHSVLFSAAYSGKFIINISFLPKILLPLKTNFFVSCILIPLALE